VKPQRLIAFAMIAVETAIVEYMLFLYEWYPAAIAALALIATPGVIALPLGRRGKIVGAVGIALFIYAGMYTSMLTFLVAHRLPFDPVLGGNALMLTWYLLALQAAVLFLRTEDGRLPVYFPVMGVVVMGCAGAIGRHGSLDPIFHAASLGYVVLIVLFVAGGKPRPHAGIRIPGRARGRLIQAAILALSLTASFAVSNVMGSYRREIDNAMFVMVPGLLGETVVGFSTHARLDSITRLRDTEANAVALRVFSRRTPDYLRGRTYDSYVRDSWNVTAPEHSLEPTQDRPEGVRLSKGMALYGLREAPKPYDAMTIAPMISADGCLFVPLEAASIAVAGPCPVTDEEGNVKAATMASWAEYEVLTSLAPVRGPLTDDARHRLLALPDDLDPRVRELAARLFAKARAPHEKIAAVLTYFSANYAYQMGIEAPRGKDPLTYFLLEQPSAHCEYFATGAAILLRLGGVPCRYVTGFVATEQNRVGGYWIARSKDAHAWVEAYDDESGTWLTVEPTVADGVPGPRQQRWTDVFTQSMDVVRYGFLRLKLAIATGRWQELLREFVARLVGWVKSPGGLLLVAIAAGYALIRHRRGRPRTASQPPLDPRAAAVVRLRRVVDRGVRRLGFTRKPEETVNAFADRIVSSLAALDEPAKAERLRQAVDWYRAYCEVRFRGPITPDQIECLGRRWREARSRARRIDVHSGMRGRT